MFKAYADESGRGDPRIFVDAGFTATADQWASFSDEWEAELKTPPAIPIFKAAQALGKQGFFRRLTKEERDAKVWRLIEIINKNVTCGAAFVVQTKPFQNALSKVATKTLDIPAFHAHAQFIWTMMRKHSDLGIEGKIDFIFDKIDETELMEIRRMWELWKEQGPYLPTWFISRMGRKPIDDNDDRMLPLQAADLAASVLARSIRDHARGISPQNSLAASWLARLTVPVGSGSWGSEMLRLTHDRIASDMRRYGATYETGKMRSARLNGYRKKASASDDEGEA